MRNEPIAPLLLSARAAAKAMAISERTLWAISAPRGPLRVVKFSRRILYSPGDLAAFIEKTKGKQKP